MTSIELINNWAERKPKSMDIMRKLNSTGGQKGCPLKWWYQACAFGNRHY